MEGGLLLNSSNEGMVFTQAKFGSSSATSTRVVPVTSWYTGTGSYTYPVVVPGGSGAISSKVYSSTEDSAICYEQLFTQSPDPRPKTPDWTNFICPFTAGDWSEWQASVYATAYTSTGCVYPKSDTPLIRAFYTASSEDALSAYLPVDGFNFRSDIPGLYGDWTAYESAYEVNGSGSGKYSASTTAWHPISEIVGTETGEMLAAVCVNMAFFNWSSLDSADSYYNWSVGLYSALPPGCAFSGKIQFRRDSDSPSSSAEATAEYTYLYSGTSTATASASSIVYNIPSGSATMSGLACHGTPPPPPTPTAFPWSAGGSMTVGSSIQNTGLMFPLRITNFMWLTTATANPSNVIQNSAYYYVVSGTSRKTAIATYQPYSSFLSEIAHRDIWVAINLSGRVVKLTTAASSNSGYSSQLVLPDVLYEGSGIDKTAVIRGIQTSDYTQSGTSQLTGSATITAKSASFWQPEVPSAFRSAISGYAPAVYGKLWSTYSQVTANYRWSASGVYVP